MMSDDLISRQDAINAANRADYTGLTLEDVKKVTDEVVKEIKKLPSAQPEDWMERNKERILQAGMEGREIVKEAYSTMTDCVSLINNAPTIVPAERIET